MQCSTQATSYPGKIKVKAGQDLFISKKKTTKESKMNFRTQSRREHLLAM